MKKIFYFLMATIILIAYSCDENEQKTPTTFTVDVQLIYPAGYAPAKDVPVTLTNTANSSVSEAKTDKSGLATFTVPAGVYDIAATDPRPGKDGVAFVLNGIKSNVTVNESLVSEKKIQLQLSKSKLSQIVIKEVFYGGTPKDDGSGYFRYDKYVILYNNSQYPASLNNICLAITLQYNPHAPNADYIGGKLFYEAEGWAPAGQAFWYFKNPVSLEPGKQIVIALANAVDNTKTYKKSINFANPEYYCTYDIDVFNHKLTYPAPAAEIPTSHYLKAVAYGAGTAWCFSVFGPAFFIFSPQGQTIKQFGDDASNINEYLGSSMLLRKKVPVNWVVDGVEIFYQPSNDNKKRLNSVIDAGYVMGINRLGYSIYRNVDKAATEAIKENKGKLVYNYAYGTENIEGGSTDPSGIDAEASLKNGARIVYKDTNNSTNDFHQRKQASLRN